MYNLAVDDPRSVNMIANLKPASSVRLLLIVDLLTPSVGKWRKTIDYL
jgi:hypothetical protein